MAVLRQRLSGSGRSLMKHVKKTKRRLTLTPVKDNEWIQPIEHGYMMSCCDCGLIHKMNFRVVDGRAEFQASRAVGYTKQYRMHRAKKGRPGLTG